MTANSEDGIVREEMGRIYDQLCQSCRAIDEMCTKLLGLLPFGTGVGLLVLIDGAAKVPRPEVALGIGLFGFVVTLGIFAYELHGIKKCASLIDAGKRMEESLHMHGQFLRRPQQLMGYIDEPFAASVIYPASLASWTLFALLGATGPDPEAGRVEDQQWIAWTVGILVFLLGGVVSLWLVGQMEHDMWMRKEYDREPYKFRGIPRRFLEIWRSKKDEPVRHRPDETEHKPKAEIPTPLPDTAIYYPPSKEAR